MENIAKSSSRHGRNNWKQALECIPEYADKLNNSSLSAFKRKADFGDARMTFFPCGIIFAVEAVFSGRMRSHIFNY